MDNNQNFQQQPYNGSQPQQQPYNGGQPQQQYNGQQFNGAPQPYGGQQPKSSFNIMRLNILESLALLFAGIGIIMVILGTILTCSCSAKKTFSAGSDGYGLSAVFIVTIFGVMFAVAAIILAILAIKQKKGGKFAQVSFVAGVAATVFGLLPLFTICGYNCSLNSKQKALSNMSEEDLYNGIMDDMDLGDLLK